ncbi:BglG family transcription antiterminator [Virgibacillus sp. 19R1-5]|uniref:BglG family transcription antiterminator n=2 Tax=unclassified Virgibacillus TaxID=2620237 RepID=UPI00090ACC7C|nr:BglG family transcription antiterminator [Virgibacillus sp. 19R1-5]API93006.1 hypothetical protein BKP57_15040 [Virgibacillus sp. 6R]MBS7428535.1 transcription antiterminator [Virgibacillus sp. 19R1-5]
MPLHINKRMQKILTCFLNADGYLTSSYLAKQVGCSAKTVREDIKKLNSELSNICMVILPKRGSGYKLIGENKDELTKRFIHDTNVVISKALQNPVTPEERMRFIVKKLLYTNNCVTISDFATELYVSESTIKNDIKHAKEILNKYNIKIRKGVTGLYAVGHEINKRFCIADFLYQNSKIDEQVIINYMYIENEATNKIIKDIKKTILDILTEENMTISDYTLKKITIHIVIAINRIKNGQYIEFNSERLHQLTNEQEFKTAEKIIASISQKYKMYFFSPEEIAYITMHLIGNRIAKKNQIASNLHELISDEMLKLSLSVIEEVNNNLKGLDLLKDEELIYSLGIHLKQLLNRLDFQMNISNPFLNTVKIKYPLAFEAGVTAAKRIMKETNFKIGDNEIGFLAMHFGAAIEKQKYQQLVKRKKIALVCASGTATSNLLLTKLSHVLEPGYRMMGVYSFHQIEELLAQKPDLILTTVPLLQKINIPVISISNILGEEDILILREDLDKYHRGEKSLVHLMKKNLFFNDVNMNNKKELLHYLTNKMIDAGYITHKIKDSIFLRESIASTAIGNKVAIPHPINIEVSKSCICTAILNNEMDWDKDEKVVIVFIIVLENKWAPYFQEIFSELYSLTSSYDSIGDLQTKNNFDDFIKDITAKLG